MEDNLLGKDIILPLGNSGSGKSTMILRILNYTLKLGIVNGLKTLVIDE